MLMSTEDGLAVPVANVLPKPYLIFLGDVEEAGYAKTAFGLRDWAGNDCVGEWALPGARVTLGLASMSPGEAVSAGAKALVIGVANKGGVIPKNWLPALREALTSGLDLVAGMHDRLDSIPELREAADIAGRRLIDVRKPASDLPIATGVKRPGRRLLTVGTDCALGKKYTALAIARSFARRGVPVDFRATGQTGIMIAGRGVPMDAVISDFAAGAAEVVSPAAPDDHWDVIEGQGSLFHPAYAGVSLALLHGSQPEVFVVCHDPRRSHMLGYPDYQLPSITDVVDMTMALGARTNPDIRCAGAAFNTSGLDAATAERLMAIDEERLGYPVADPMRGGAAFDRLVDACLAAN